MLVDNLLKERPYGRLKREEFLAAMREAISHHYKNSAHFRKFLDTNKFLPEGSYALKDIPFIPVAIFKELELITGASENIRKRIFSSSTTSNKRSMICLDQITIDRQRIALSQIMSDFAGDNRKIFIIFDSPKTVNAVKGEMSSRGSAIRGMLMMANRHFFVLKNDLSIDAYRLKEALSSLKKGGDIFFFGFTWVIYQLLSDARNDEKRMFESLVKNSSKSKALLHIGGWKKLSDLKIEKQDFNNLVARNLFVKPRHIIDIYGLTEQLGTVYPDCPYGFKHVPLYSDVITRDPANFLPLPPREKGLLQFVTPIPHSYPGISVLSDDIGTIIGLDGCSCGRKGKFFIFNKREENAELRGCGDTAYLF